MWQTSTLSVHMEGYKNCIMDTGHHDTYIQSHTNIRYVHMSRRTITISCLSSSSATIHMHEHQWCRNHGENEGWKPLENFTVKNKDTLLTTCRLNKMQMARQTGSERWWHRHWSIHFSPTSTNNQVVARAYLIFLFHGMWCLSTHFFLPESLIHSISYSWVLKTCNSTFVLYLTSGLGVWVSQVASKPV